MSKVVLLVYSSTPKSEMPWQKKTVYIVLKWGVGEYDRIRRSYISVLIILHRHHSIAECGRGCKIDESEACNVGEIMLVSVLPKSYGRRLTKKAMVRLNCNSTRHKNCEVLKSKYRATEAAEHTYSFPKWLVCNAGEFLVSFLPKSEIMVKRSRREPWYCTTITVPYAKTTKYCSVNIVLHYRSNGYTYSFPKWLEHSCSEANEWKRSPWRRCE